MGALWPAHGRQPEPPFLESSTCKTFIVCAQVRDSTFKERLRINSLKAPEDPFVFPLPPHSKD
eukprot:scaffold4264_cov116-Isochrysis_galbana.AAC.10